jgi:hypothetical protein
VICTVLPGTSFRFLRIWPVQLNVPETVREAAS